jgi:hypothetical protein
VQALADRAMIRDVVVALSYALDRHDETLLRECIAPDARVAGDLIRSVSGDDGRRASMTDHTWRVMNNHLLTVSGDDARVQSYVFIVERPPGTAQPTSWADGARRFSDRLRRVADGWRLTERVVDDNVMPDEKVIVRPVAERGIEPLIRRAHQRAQEQSNEGRR